MPVGQGSLPSISQSDVELAASLSLPPPSGSLSLSLESSQTEAAATKDRAERQAAAFYK